MNGVASGLRSSAWNTTPAAASALPTNAAASTRGRRATKKICASTLSAKAIDGSKTRVRLMDVLPTTGASRQAPHASTPNPSMARAARAARARRASSRPPRHRPSRAAPAPMGERNDDEVTGGLVAAHVGLDVERAPDVVAREHVRGPSGRERPPIP